MKRLFVVILAALLLSSATLTLAQKSEPAAERPTLKGDWKFPSPKVKERRDGATALYELGEGFIASRVKLEGKELVIVGIPQTEDTASAPDSELAFIVAGLSLKLCTDFGKLFLEPNDSEFRFRTLNGDTAGVTLASDRKTAVVRILPVEMQ